MENKKNRSLNEKKYFLRLWHGLYGIKIQNSGRFPDFSVEYLLWMLYSYH